ncbi:hypothetical protein Tco_0680245 [Tanacetum coccineum]|uniref:DDE Tnp4 domain-containing protein n=1 Tax=Tanacetum coccineum TaxID=301880 RepID=A0ABQ4XKX1_9ASTR
MESVKKSIAERARHQRQYDRSINKRQMQKQESKVDLGNALNASLVVIESKWTKLGKHDTSSRSRNDTDVDDADISPSYDEEPMAEVQTTAENNVFAIERQLADQPEFNLGKGVCKCCIEKKLRRLTGNKVDTKFAKPSILGKPPLHPFIHQSVVRQPTTFKSERPKFTKQRFASQAVEKNALTKPVTLHSFPQVKESAFAKPHHVIASGSPRNSSSNVSNKTLKESYGLNDMIHHHYLNDARNKAQALKDRNLIYKPSVMPSARSQNIATSTKPKPSINNQTSRNCPTSNRLKIHQSPRGILINPSKYALEILKTHGMEKCDRIGTPMATSPKLDADLSGTPIDKTRYLSIIGSLMNLIASRPDLVQVVEKGIVELYFVRTEYQLAGMFTKALLKEKFKYPVGRLGMRCLTPAVLEIQKALAITQVQAFSRTLKRTGPELEEPSSKQQKSTESTIPSVPDVPHPPAVSSPKSSGTRRKSLSRNRLTKPKSILKELDLDADDKTFIKFVSDEAPILWSALAGWEVISTPLGEINALYRSNQSTKHFTTLREILHMVDRQDLLKLYGMVVTYYENHLVAGAGLMLWGDLQVLMDSQEGGKGSFVWNHQSHWQIRSWRLYTLSNVHVLETVSGEVLYMFADVSYPLSVKLMERMLKHKLEIDKDVVGNDMTTAEQLIRFIKNQIAAAQVSPV